MQDTSTLATAYSFLPIAHGKASVFIWKICTSCQNSEVILIFLPIMCIIHFTCVCVCVGERECVVSVCEYDLCVCVCVCVFAGTILSHSLVQHREECRCVVW